MRQISLPFYAPNFEKVGTYWFQLVRMYVCMGHRDIVLKLHVWIPHGKIADAYFFVFPELSPLVKLRPFDKRRDEICKCRISNSIKARNLKLVSADRG